MKRLSNVAPFLWLICMVYTVGNAVPHTAHALHNGTGLQNFFDTIDRDHDGQLEQEEVLQYVDKYFGGDTELQTAQDKNSAIQQMIGNVDSNDWGAGISVSELDKHLHKLLQGVRVHDWVRHGLNLPQYATAFKLNAITVLDLPTLVNDGGSILTEELGVKSKLHQQQILRGIKLLLLGLGRTPSSVQELHCIQLDARQLLLTWLPPLHRGSPSQHKYVLERVAVRPPHPAWEVVAQPEEALPVVDTPPPGVYMYRVAAWNVFGRGEYALSSECEVMAADTAVPSVFRKHGSAALNWSARDSTPSLEAPPVPVASRIGGWLWTSANSVLLLAFSFAVRFVHMPSLLAAAQAVRRRMLGSPRHPHQAAPAVPAGTPAAPRERPWPSHSSLSQLDSASSSLDPEAHPSTDPLRPHQALRGYVPQPVEGIGGAVGLTAPSSGSPQQRSLLRNMSQGRTFSRGDGDSNHGGDGQPRLAATAAQGLHGLRKVVSTSSILGLGEHRDGSPSAGRATTSRNSPAADPVKRKKCAFEGCTKDLAMLASFRNHMQRHYCCRCQHYVCLDHTAYSPHGATGGCGQDSRCVCQACFQAFTPEYQACLAASNTLTTIREKRRTKTSSEPARGEAETGAEGGGRASLWGVARLKVGAVARLKIAGRKGHEGRQ